MSSSIFAVYLLWASCQDVKEMQVVRYTHLLGVLGIVAEAMYHIGVMQVALSALWIEWLLAIVVHMVLQAAAVYFKLYGVADGFIYVMCSMLWAIKYGLCASLLGYFLLQMIAGTLLLAVQIGKRNLKGAVLKAPVPYIPYISVAFFLTNGVL